MSTTFNPYPAGTIGFDLFEEIEHLSTHDTEAIVYHLLHCYHIANRGEHEREVAAASEAFLADGYEDGYASGRAQGYAEGRAAVLTKLQGLLDTLEPKPYMADVDTKGRT
jgi:hypothetical protein